MEHQAFNGTTKGNGVLSSRQEWVVVELKGIPVVEVGRAAADAAGKVAHAAADQNLSRGPPSKCRSTDAEIDSGCVRIDRLQALIVADCFVVSSDAKRVCELGR